MMGRPHRGLNAALVMAWTVPPTVAAMFAFLVGERGANFGGPPLFVMVAMASSFLGFRHLRQRAPEQYKIRVVLLTCLFSALVVTTVLVTYRWVDQPGWFALLSAITGLFTWAVLVVGGFLASPRNLR